MRRTRTLRSLAVIAALAITGSVRADERPAWRVLVYACADLQDADNDIVQSLLKQLVSASEDRSVDVMGFVDVQDGKSMKLCRDAELNASCLVERCPSGRNCRSGDVDMGYAGSASDREVSTLRSQLIDPATQRPAPTNGTIVLIVGHADGWLGCQFDTTGAPLASETVAAALRGGKMQDGLEHAPLNASVLAFYGCSMGQIEALLPVADVADHLVAGELEIEADSIDFGRWLEWLRSDPERTPKQVASRLAELYHCAPDAACGACAKRDSHGSHLMAAMSASGIKQAAEKLEEFAKAAHGLAPSALTKLHEHLARRREGIRPWYSGIGGYAVDVVGLLSDPSPAAALADVFGPSNDVVDAVRNAVVCRSFHPTVASFGGLAVLFSCRKGILADYEPHTSARMPNWLAFERDYAENDRCSSDPERKIRPVVDAPGKRDPPFISIGGKQHLRYELVGVPPAAIVDVTWTVFGEGGAVVGDGIPVATDSWDATTEGGLRVNWDGGVRRVATDGTETPSAVESERVVTSGGASMRYSTVLAHWMSPCGERWTPVRLVFAREEGLGVEATGILVDAQELPNPFPTSSWGSTIDVTDGRLSIDASRGVGPATRSLCSLGVGDASRVRLTRAFVDPGIYRLVLTIRLGSGASLVSPSRTVEVVPPLK